MTHMPVEFTCRRRVRVIDLEIEFIVNIQNTLAQKANPRMVRRTCDGVKIEFLKT